MYFNILFNFVVTNIFGPPYKSLIAMSFEEREEGAKCSGTPKAFLKFAVRGTDGATTTNGETQNEKG